MRTFDPRSTARAGRGSVPEVPDARSRDHVKPTGASSRPIPEGDAVLSDGSTVHIRSLESTDRERLVAFFNSLSRETRRRRFFSPLTHLEGPLLDRLLEVDNDRSIVIVAERDRKIVGVGRANRTADPADPAAAAADATPTAEVAFTVDDGLHGLGIATLLLEALVSRARLVGIVRFVAVTQSDNHEMMRVFQSSGFDASMHRDPEDPAITLVSFPIADDEHSRDAQRQRERRAAHASLQPLLRPRSIAVIGASVTGNSPGRRIVHELLAHGFTGTLSPVNPAAADSVGGPLTIESIAVAPRIGDVTGPVDLAIIAVPAAAVVDVAEQCAAAGVHGILVVSAGFAEIGPAGRLRQDELLAVVRRSGMRLIGPNCLGVVTTDEAVRMQAVFTELQIVRGGIALMSQSGAVAIAMASMAAQERIGLSSFVSVGNKADVSGNDLLDYWDQDDSTRVIALYLESFGNPRKFARIARDVSRRKPIVAIKAARSKAGARAAASHTGALTAEDATVDALFAQAGVLRVDDPRELLALAYALERLPLPAGRRVAIVGNAGGLAILTADALATEGLVLADLQPATITRLGALAPPNASLKNPVDLTASATSEQLREALASVLDDPGVDAIVAVYVTIHGDEERRTLDMLEQTNRTATKPVVSMFASPPHEAVLAACSGAAVRAATPREAALIVGRMAARAEWLARPDTIDRPIGDDTLTRIRRLIHQALSNDRSNPDDGGWLPPTVAFELLALAGIAVAAPIEVTNADEALDAAASIGFPVSLKAANPSLVHRSDRGAVRIGLRDEYNVLCAYQAIEHALRDDMHGAFVQPMAETGVEMILGIKNDPLFGPLVLVGSGGRNAEIWQDTAVHLAPFDRDTATAMIKSLRSYRLLDGFRASPVADQAALADAVVRVGQLAAAFPEIAELDANPLIVHPSGLTAVDVKIRLNSTAPLPDGDLRMK